MTTSLDETSGLPLQSDRLILRSLEDRDLEGLMGYHNDPEVGQHQGWVGMSEGQARDFIARLKNRPLGEPGEWTQIALEHKDTGELLGDLGFRVNAEYLYEAELGYRLARAYQHQGFATEAVSRLLDHAFSALNLHRIIAYIACENQPSITLVERLGFRREGHLKQSYDNRGTWIDEYLYAILDNEWRT